MKKVAFFVLLITFCASLWLIADERQDLWLKAAAEKDPQLRLQYFEEFLQKYGEKEGKHSKYMYFNLSQSSFQLKKYDNSIKYGEKALEYKDLEANLKLQTYLILANAFNVTKSDLDRAYHYAGLVIEFGNSIKMTTETTNRSEQLSKNIDMHFIAPAYRIQTHILFERGKEDPEQLVEAIQKGIAAYKIHKTDRTRALILSLAYRLSKMDRVDKAIEFVEMVCDDDKGDAKGYNMLGTWYNKKGDKEKAIFYFDKFYQSQDKDNQAAKTALNLGVLLSKRNKMKAIEYFAEAFLLLDSDKESKAYKYLQQLWFNEIAKGKPQEEQDQGLADILNAARSRLNI